MDFNKLGEWQKNVLVEAHGLLFDLLVFGILLTLYDLSRQKKDRIERYNEEIDDFRDWDEKEAMHRIVGNIKRLNKEGVTQIDLQRCYLKDANLEGTNLDGALLVIANLTKAYLNKASLIEADLSGTDLTGAKLLEANLTRTNLQGANLTNVLMYQANLHGANLNQARGLSSEMLKSCFSLYGTKGIPKSIQAELREEKPELFEKPQNFARLTKPN